MFETFAHHAVKLVNHRTFAGLIEAMQKIKFGTDGWRAIIGKDYTVKNVQRVSYATANWLKDKYDSSKIVIGHDCRFGGKMFMEESAKTFAACGVEVIMAHDFVTTPMISLATKELNAQLGIVITASHNPPSYNGFKIKDHFGGPALPETIQEIEDKIPDTMDLEAKLLDHYKEQGLVHVNDLEKIYVDRIKESFDLAAIYNANIKIAYDAMWGAGRKVMQDLLPGSTFLHVGDNPGFKGIAPEPLDRNLQELSNMLKNSSNLQLGIANDGDADRIGMYDAEGNYIDSHHIILLLIHYLKKYKDMDGKVCVAFSVSEKVRKLCEHYNLPIDVTKIGFKHIAGKMVNEDVLLGGEESGGIATKGHIPERDGIWMGLVILEFMAITGKNLNELIHEVYDVVGEFKFERYDLRLTDEAKQNAIEYCQRDELSSFGEYKIERKENIDGYKFHLNENEWVLVRPSGTEPVLRVYAESPTRDGAFKILDTVKSVLNPT